MGFSLNSLNRKVEDFLTNSKVKLVISVLLLVAIFTVKYHPYCCVVAYSKLWLQLIFIVLIVYFACIEPIYAILLTALLIANIYELRNRTLAHSAVLLKLNQTSQLPAILGGSGDISNKPTLGSVIVPSTAPPVGEPALSSDLMYRYLSDERNKGVPTKGELLVNHKMDNHDNIISDANLQNRVRHTPGDILANLNDKGSIMGPGVSYVDIIPDNAKNSIESLQYSHPASHTLSENLAEFASSFVTRKDLSNAQMNIVTGFECDNKDKLMIPIGKDPNSINNSAPLL